MESFKMALLQLICEFGEVEKNVLLAERKIREAHQNGAQFVCLPEAFNTGYYCNRIEEMAKMAEPLNGHTITRLQSLANELGIYIMAPIVLKVGENTAENTAVLIGDDGKIVGIHSKTHPVGDEAKYFQRGTKYNVYKTKFGSIGMLVCYDICFPETARILALKGADMILVPVACRDLKFYREWLFNNFKARGIDNVLFLAGACMAGRNLPESPFTGCSMFISPRGEILSQASVENEEILYHEIDLGTLALERWENTVLIDRHPEDYKILSQI
jgi:predicted amidohydrolase